MFHAVLLCYLPFLGRETLHQIRPDLKFLSSYKLHGFYAERYGFYYHCNYLHRLLQNIIQFQTFSCMITSTDHLISFYGKMLKFANIIANYQNQCSTNFHLELNRNPKLYFCNAIKGLICQIIPETYIQDH